jgi:hypothetical protein
VIRHRLVVAAGAVTGGVGVEAESRPACPRAGVPRDIEKSYIYYLKSSSSNDEKLFWRQFTAASMWASN